MGALKSDKSDCLVFMFTQSKFGIFWCNVEVVRESGKEIVTTGWNHNARSGIWSEVDGSCCFEGQLSGRGESLDVWVRGVKLEVKGDRVRKNVCSGFITLEYDSRSLPRAKCYLATTTRPIYLTSLPHGSLRVISIHKPSSSPPSPPASAHLLIPRISRFLEFQSEPRTGQKTKLIIPKQDLQHNKPFKC